MFEKLNKYFKISAAIGIVAIILPLTFAYILLILDSKLFLMICFVLIGVCFLLTLPICFLVQFFTLILKIFVKNKNKKQWINILIHLLITGIIGCTFCIYFLIFLSLV